MALRKRLLLLFVLCLSLLLQGGAAQAVDERPAKRQRLGPRRYGQRLVWSYDELTDFEFFRNYRMTKDQFRHLVTRIRHRLPGATALGKARQVASSGAAVPPEIQLSIALRYLAGGSYIDICRVHLVSYGSFYQVTNRVIEAILAEMNHLVSLDLRDEDLLHRLSDGFRRKTNGIVRGCIGAIDGICIQIRRPAEKFGPSKFYCRKGFYSLNVQAVCDANRRFTFVSIMAPGSSHDSMAFSLSWLSKAINGIGTVVFPRGWFIVGDDAYRSGDTIAVPWPGRNLTREKIGYNYWQSRFV